MGFSASFFFSFEGSQAPHTVKGGLPFSSSFRPGLLGEHWIQAILPAQASCHRRKRPLCPHASHLSSPSALKPQMTPFHSVPNIYIPLSEAILSLPLTKA